MASLRTLKILVFGLGIIILGLLAALFFIPSNSDTPIDDGRPRVVVTFFPLYDFVHEVAGDLVHVDILFSQTPEVTSYKPSDIALLNNANLLLVNGAGLEPIIDEMLQATDNETLRTVDTGSNLASIDGDPHIWLDPRNAAAQVQAVTEALVLIDPDNAAVYRVKGAQYVRELRALDTEIAEATATFSQKELITFHPAFSYFAQRYGLTLLATFEETPGKEPSPADLARISELVTEYNLRAFFVEPQFSSKAVDVLAKDLNIEVRELDPLETGTPNSDTYISLMRKNLETLKDVLQ